MLNWRILNEKSPKDKPKQSERSKKVEDILPAIVADKYPLTGKAITVPNCAPKQFILEQVIK